MKKFPKSLQRLLDGRETKRSALSDKERFQKAPNKNLTLETRYLVVDKDKDVPIKEDRSTKHNLKILLTLNTQRSNKQTLHQIECTSMYAQQCC